jgi:hypothetical protein
MIFIRSRGYRCIFPLNSCLKLNSPLSALRSPLSAHRSPLAYELSPEGNHRLTAWWRHINNHHANEKSWHISVDCIIVDPRGYTGVFFNAMSDINW